MALPDSQTFRDFLDTDDLTTYHRNLQVAVNALLPAISFFFSPHFLSYKMETEYLAMEHQSTLL